MQKTLQRHIRAQHLGEKHSCVHCDKQYKYVSDKAKHEQICTGKQIQFQQNICDFCGKSYKVKRNLTNHVQAQHMNISYPCSICGRPFKYPGDKTRHEKTICKAEKKIYKCTTECSSLDALNAHKKTHEKQQNLALSRKRKHEELSKDQSNTKIKQQRLETGVRCRVCYEMFPSRHALYLHRMKHHNQSGSGTTLQQPPWGNGSDPFENNDDLREVYESTAL